ncbi:hypothetical protein KW850_06040 [Bacillus sp. sid0103]|uniref:hypothetical protein n=1 Tax=Bacillus sp. sid0103 TaxID=2856337 RepID=UPI001C458A45|nr:hypothetical protein [Bacillus sp. sid0103]MBV7504823.1 hypothetical protein [Bacillus sp. sid0103]
MLDYNEPNIRKQIAAILITVAKKIEEDEEFAKSIFDCLDERGEEIKNINNKKKSTKTTPTYDINIFEIYQKEGPQGLLLFLESLDLQGLKKIVVQNGLDPAQKVRRWRVKGKIISHIVDTVGKQMSKGEAFFK